MDDKPIGIRLNFLPGKHKELKKHKEALGLTWEEFLEAGSKAIKKLEA